MCAHECKEFFTCSLMSFNCCCSFSSLCASTAFGEPPESFAADSVRAVFVIVGLFEMFVDAKLKEERPFLVGWSCFLLWFWFFSLVWFTLVWLGLVCSGLFYILDAPKWSIQSLDSFKNASLYCLWKSHKFFGDFCDFCDSLNLPGRFGDITGRNKHDFAKRFLHQFGSVT